MPKMDGHRLTKLVKDDPRLKCLPVVIFSSLIDDQMRVKGHALGETGCNKIAAEETADIKSQVFCRIGDEMSMLVQPGTICAGLCQNVFYRED